MSGYGTSRTEGMRKAILKRRPQSQAQHKANYAKPASGINVDVLGRRYVQ